MKTDCEEIKSEIDTVEIGEKEDLPKNLDAR